MSRIPTRRERANRPPYHPPDRANVQELPAQRVGITNGLLLKFPIVYAVGELALIERPRVAIVGARKATPQGQQRAAQLARDLARAGIVVVSGLAEGIDRVAHETALAHGGKTIAVVGTPLDKVYPYEHASLQEEIYRHHLLVSPFRWGDRFYPSNFPERNRVMARLALATVIVEASDTSGSLHQAAESVTVGHNVFIARSVAEDAKLKWPGRFIGKPHATVLESSKQVIEYVAG